MKTEKIDRRHVDDLICQAFSLGCEGIGSGSAFRCHPKWVRRGNLLLVSHWHVDGICHVDVITEPSANVSAGCHDPCVNGDAWPQVDKGELRRVWYSGTWQIRGPWEADLLAAIESLENEIALRRKAKEEREQAEQRRARQETAKSEQALRELYITASPSRPIAREIAGEVTSAVKG